MLGPEHPATALSLNNLGALLDSRGSWQAQLLRPGSGDSGESAGSEHPIPPSEPQQSGLSAQAQGAAGKPSPYCDPGSGDSGKVLGPEHPDTASSLNNLGALLQTQGQLAEAQPCTPGLLAIWEKVLGPEHPNTALSLNNLAELYRMQGRYAGLSLSISTL